MESLQHSELLLVCDFSWPSVRPFLPDNTRFISRVNQTNLDVFAISNLVMSKVTGSDILTRVSIGSKFQTIKIDATYMDPLSVEFLDAVELETVTFHASEGCVVDIGDLHSKMRKCIELKEIHFVGDFSFPGSRYKLTSFPAKVEQVEILNTTVEVPDTAVEGFSSVEKLILHDRAENSINMAGIFPNISSLSTTIVSPLGVAEHATFGGTAKNLETLELYVQDPRSLEFLCCSEFNSSGIHRLIFHSSEQTLIYDAFGDIVKLRALVKLKFYFYSEIGQEFDDGELDRFIDAIYDQTGVLAEVFHYLGERVGRTCRRIRLAR